MCLARACIILTRIFRKLDIVVVTTIGITAVIIAVITEIIIGSIINRDSIITIITQIEVISATIRTKESTIMAIATMGIVAAIKAIEITIRITETDEYT